MFLWYNLFMKNHGVLLGQRDSDYIGGTLPYEIVNPSGDWAAYLPDPEWQTTAKTDTMACVSFSALNCIETLVYFHTGKKVNFSDRFLAYMSGTTIHGNFLFKVADSIRKDGLILQEEWKTEPDMDWATYYAVPPIELINKAKKFLDEWIVNYEFIDFNKESLIKHLKQSPIQVVIPGHAVMLFATTEQVYKYFDHYVPFQKDRAEPFISALKYVITRKPMYKLIKSLNFEDTYFIDENGNRILIGDYKSLEIFNGKLWDKEAINIISDNELKSIKKGGTLLYSASE